MHYTLHDILPAVNCLRVTGLPIALQMEGLEVASKARIGLREGHQSNYLTYILTESTLDGTYNDLSDESPETHYESTNPRRIPPARRF